ncbi:hypothetical protein PVAND_006671 [Polypedilum vanderplanki]|uniref:Nicastrin n=1 Tax=Polypedilum vanderplanki TaxID=319348 RepID=A0A9J6C4T6_POLVA|nr:hypothetical protein PVAND_006671 [Polypedilum vanderplanki]
MIKIKLILLNIVILVNTVYCDRTKDKIYENISGHMCFRRLNATHQTGCSSAGKSRGSVGVLHLISSEDDINFIINDPPSPPYAPIILPNHFTRENIIKLRDSNYVSAIVLVNDTSDLDNFSQESKCPNQFFRHAKQPVCDSKNQNTVWNPFGTGLLHENFDIPIIFLAKKEESDKVIKCYNDFNKASSRKSLCSIEINSFMAASGNSEICIRRSRSLAIIRQLTFCDPLQGKNVYGTLYPREIVNPINRTNDIDEKFIIVSAHFDTTSMFDGIALGAMEFSSVATLISSAHFLKKIIKKDKKSKYNILFMLFNGESYDYIGSQRFIYDLKKNDSFPSPSSYTRPLTLDNIVMMIDIGALDDFDSVSIYHLNESESFASKFTSAINSYNNKLKLNVNINAVNSNNLPPVSAQMFLRENPNFPTLIFASKKPKNKFYHSVYDDVKNMKFSYYNTSEDFDQLDDSTKITHFPSDSIQIKIRNVATLISLGLYNLLNEDNKYAENLIASSTLVDEFLYCYLKATKCRLFDSIFVFSNDFNGLDYPPQRYVSVQAAITLEATGWAYRVLGFVLSQKIENIQKENCTVLPYYWIPGSLKTGECRLTTQNLSYALSPAFEEEGYNYKSNLYSTWTESTWNDLSARIFLQPSTAHESLTFIIGLIMLILSFILVYFINSKAEILFNDINTEHVALPAQC